MAKLSEQLADLSAHAKHAEGSSSPIVITSPRAAVLPITEVLFCNLGQSR